MIDSDVYCIEVLKQLAALRSSLDRVGRIMLQHHLERCFLEDVRTGERREAIHELMNTLAYDKNFV